MSLPFSRIAAKGDASLSSVIINEVCVLVYVFVCVYVCVCVCVYVCASVLYVCMGVHKPYAAHASVNQNK